MKDLLLAASPVIVLVTGQTGWLIWDTIRRHREDRRIEQGQMT